METNSGNNRVLVSQAGQEPNELTCYTGREKIKGSKNLNVPPLRFPEFTDEWEECELQNISHISKGVGISKDQLSAIGSPCVLYGELYTKYKSEIITEVFSKTNIDDSHLVHSKRNDIIIPSSGETAIDISTARCIPFDDILLGGDLTIIRLHEHDGRFFSYQLNGVRKLDIARIAQGVSVIHLYGESLKRLKVKYPSINEQNKISSLLELIDERIATQRRIIDKLQSLMGGITQKIAHSQETKMAFMRDLLFERVERNSEQYAVHSVSVSEGVINQIVYLGRSFAATDTSHYNVVHYGDIVYTKSPTGNFPYGIVKRSWIKENAAVSPLYGVYEPLNDDVGIYLHFYFCSPFNAKNYMHKLIQKGAKNTINITNQRFLENYVPIPPVQVLQKYVQLITLLSEKLILEQALYNALNRHKSYLQQQMFI